MQPQAGWPVAAAPAAAAYPVRVYVVRGVARNGRSGPPSARVPVPLGAVPDAPGGLAVRNTEKAVVVEWLPGLATVGGGLLRYNVYEADAPVEPLNSESARGAHVRAGGGGAGDGSLLPRPCRGREQPGSPRERSVRSGVPHAEGRLSAGGAEGARSSRDARRGPVDLGREHRGRSRRLHRVARRDAG